jgi:hypothetical protein
MEITDEILHKLGFKLLMMDYWKKDDFGILRAWRNGKCHFIYFNTEINTVEDLAEVYRKKTGKALI